MPAKKSTAKKRTVKKTTARRVTTKKAPSKRVSVQKKTTTAALKLANSAIPEKQTKTQIMKQIAEDTGLTNSQIKTVFESLQNLVERHMKKRGSGEFAIPNLGVKVRRVRKKATKKRLGRNPFTGEEIMIPAKPARDVIRVSAMKALKEVIQK